MGFIMDIILKDAKMLFEQGAIVGWHLDAIYNEWVLYLKMIDRKEKQLYSHTGNIRYFKTVNAGISAVQAIGFEVSSLSN